MILDLSFRKNEEIKMLNSNGNDDIKIAPPTPRISKIYLNK